MEPLMTSDELATYLRVDVVTIRRLVNRGDLTAYRVGGEYRFMEPDVAEYLQRQRVPANESGGPDAIMVDKLVQAVRRLFPEGRDRFDRFTQRARKALSLATEEARMLQHNYVGTEHLLLGLLRERGGIAARGLHNLGVELSEARLQVEQIIGKGEQSDAIQQPGLTPRAKKTIELAVDEARKLGHHYLGTEHLLMGIVREGEGLACEVLKKLGVALEAVQPEIIRLLGEHVERPPVPPEASSLIPEGERERTCSNCGAHCPAYFRHCFNCGLSLPQPLEKSEPQSEEQSAS
jgi:excisionase family DNA binding protein